MLENDFKDLQLAASTVTVILIDYHDTVWLCEEGQKPWFMGSPKGFFSEFPEFFEIFIGVI